MLKGRKEKRIKMKERGGKNDRIRRKEEGRKISKEWKNRYYKRMQERRKGKGLR